MTAHLIYTGLLIAFFAWTITMQVITKHVTVKRLVLLPAAFTVLAVFSDHGWSHRLHAPAAIGFFGAGLVLAAGMGLARAATMKVWTTPTGPMSKGNGLTVLTWLATIAVRVAVMVVALKLNVPEGAGEIMLFVAVTLATQNLVIARRAGLRRRTGAAISAAARAS